MNNSEVLEYFSRILGQLGISIIKTSANDSRSKPMCNKRFVNYLDSLKREEYSYKRYFFELIYPNKFDFKKVSFDIVEIFKNSNELQIIKKFFTPVSYKDYKYGHLDILFKDEKGRTIEFEFVSHYRKNEIEVIVEFEEEPNVDLFYQEEKILDLLKNLTPLQKKQLPKLFNNVLSVLFNN